MLDEGMQHGLQVREADRLPHHDAFDLVEHRRVRHIRVVAIDAPGAITASGGFISRMARICTGEVCVRSSLPSGK